MLLQSFDAAVAAFIKSVTLTLLLESAASFFFSCSFFCVAVRPRPFDLATCLYASFCYCCVPGTALFHGIHTSGRHGRGGKAYCVCTLFYTMIVTKHASYKFDRLSHPSSDPGPTQYQNQREEVLVEHQRSVVDVKSKPRMSHVTYIRCLLYTSPSPRD